MAHLEWVILYARVSTVEQAEKELSIPAQLRLLRAEARRNTWHVAGEFVDVGSGRSFRERPNLLHALRLAARQRGPGALLVHKADRLARNTMDYLMMKRRLAERGARIISLVEHFEESPMGNLIELIMAAHSEFYSANLSEEVKKGMEERARRGLWNGSPAVGYVQQGKGLVFDPARAPRIRELFGLWSTGAYTCSKLADEIHARGLVGVRGKKIAGRHLIRMLHNTFYAGFISHNGVKYPGKHEALVSPDLFERCQQVFALKHTGGRPRRHLTFLLSRLVACPNCASTLTAEEHVKRSGRTYRYYRCARVGCRFLVRCEVVDAQVWRSLVEQDLVGPTADRGDIETLHRVWKVVVRVCLVKRGDFLSFTLRLRTGTASSRLLLDP